MSEPTEIPPRRRIDWTSALMALVTLAASLGALWFYFGRHPGDAPLVVGSQAPLLQLTDLETSEPLLLAGMHGKVVWIVFWSAGSTTGPASLPVFERAWKGLKGHRRFGMAAAAVDSEPARVRAAVASSGVDIPVYLASPESRRRYRAEKADPPLNVLLDAEGQVAAIARGTAPQTIDRIARQADRLLQELDPLGRVRFAGPPSLVRKRLVAFDLADAGEHELVQERVRTERSSQAELHARVALLELVACQSEIALNVHTRRQEVRDQEHASRTPGHAPECTGGNVRLSQLEETPFNDGIASRGGQTRDELVKVVVGRLLAAAVCNQEDGGVWAWGTSIHGKKVLSGVG